MTMVKAHVSTHELVAGRYRPLDVLHRETNRTCWYGEDVGSERPCLLTEIALPAGTDEETSLRTAAGVVRMSKTMRVLSPGRIAAVVDAVAQDGVLWTVTEPVDGIPLGELLGRQGTFDHVRAARVGLELLEVLEAAHGEGITHGELSPGQVFVHHQGSVVVTGFGLAGATLAPRLSAPSYASPEQARDERIGPAADLWALGAILYTLVEGRPPFRDRDRPAATLKGVDRLPLRAPVRAGPLTPVVQGLLRKSSQERMSRASARSALLRVLDEDPQAALQEEQPRSRRVLHGVAPGRGSRLLVAGTALAVVTVAAAVLVVTKALPGSDSSTTGEAPAPSASASASAPAPVPPAPSPSVTAPGNRTDESPRPPSSPAPTPSPSRSATPTAGTGLPAGYREYHSPEGFSLALPKGWKPLETSRQEDLAYRVTFGASGDPRTLAVTYSKAVGTDAVAVWRDDVEPGLRDNPGYERLGDIRATSYQGRQAADMQWVEEVDGTRVRTFGRGFLIGEGRGYSLRWTTPAADWNDDANQEALDTFLRTFRVPSS
ncbi:MULTISPECIES: serine/threonine-protein kinase [Streptomyces]|uniref:non-specific serine/threonine protein kinase n=1 Tax=Streptomyces pseudovenezuelae TaxID=67350 RepID=A0A117PQV8_9ACTN|nr:MULTISPECIES: serine/threonine-protein kinase [Streptomyces]KUM86768.1 serine/threonine protein kinase [Streptomyces pseudovenezuelae]